MTKNHMYTSIKIRNLMEDRNMRGQDLATKIGTSRAYVSTVLSGKVGVSEDKLADMLTRGFGMGLAGARRTIALWQVEDIISQNPDILPQIAELVENENKKSGNNIKAKNIKGAVMIGGSGNNASVNTKSDNENAMLNKLISLSPNERDKMIELLKLTKNQT